MQTLDHIVSLATGLAPSGFRIVLRPPLDYQSNRLYDVWASNRHLIAKEFVKPDEMVDAPAREFRALQLLAPLDIAPQPVFFRPELGPVVVYEFMEGEMWDRRHPTPSELAELAALWLQINALPTDGLWISRGHEQSWHEVEARFRGVFQQYLDWTTAAFPVRQRAAQICLDLLEARQSVTRGLAGAEPVLCFCRSDQRFANVIRRRDGRLGMIDWEDSGLRDPARDLADVMMHPNQEDLLTTDEWQAFLRPYLAGRGVSDPSLVERVHLYLALFPIYWLAVLIRRGMQLTQQGQPTGWTVNGLAATQRLRRYLARALAWPNRHFHRQLEDVADVEFFPAR